MFEAIADDAQLGTLYWRETLCYLEALPLPYLTMNIIELIFGNDIEAYCKTIEAAIRGDASAIPHLKTLSLHDEYSKPCPPDVARSFAAHHLYEDEYKNGRALAIGLDYMFEWRLSVGSAEPKPIPVNFDDPQSNFYTINGELNRLPGNDGKNRYIVYGRKINQKTNSVEVVVWVASQTEAQMQALLQSGPFCQAIFGEFDQRLEAACKKYDYRWLGYIFCSNEKQESLAKRNKTGRDVWLDLPATRTAIASSTR